MIIKLEKIVSCSSEHPSYPSSNLLHKSPPGPWKCANPGEMTTTVVFELSQSSFITGIDIGNYRSKLVIITASTSQEPINWVFILNHQFMTHDEAVNNKFKDQVQKFTKKELNPDTIKRKFDRVKVTCMQSANLKELFGLNSITLHTDTCGKEKDTLIPSSSNNFNNFDDNDSDSISNDNNHENGRLSDNISDDERLAGPSTSKRKRIKLIKEKNKSKCSICSRNPDDLCNFCKRLSAPTPNKSPPRKKSKSKGKKFTKLLDDVRFSMSGYVNPQRDEIRRKALKMGAKYISDPNTTNNKCTHLICAFKNTPKYQQFRGHAKIVSHAFIEECFDHKKRFPWRRYALSSSDRRANESEEEIEESSNPYDQDTDSD